MPKTIQNVYDDAVSFEKLLKAHKKARRGKREKRGIIIFELNIENELLRLEKELKKGKITLPEIQRSIAGWLSYVKHADSYGLRKSMFYIEG